MFDYFLKKLPFFGEKMPRKKKTTNKKIANLSVVKESNVTTLATGAVEIYKNKCLNSMVQLDYLNNDQKREISSILDQNESVVKTSIIDQVALLFK